MFISIAKRGIRWMILPIAVLLWSMTGWVQAGQLSYAAPAGGSAVRAWSVPFNPVSQGMMTGLQGFLRTQTGESLLAQVPSLSIIEHMSPDSEAHRRIIGALGLSADFEAQLRTAIETSDSKALASVLIAILRAYQSRDTEGVMREAAQTRADEIAAAFHRGEMSVAELSDAASELAPFTSISAGAKALESMASAMRSENAFAIRAIEMMARAGKDMRPSIDNLKRFSNQPQLDALESLIENGYQIYDKLPAIARFDNAHQVAALKAMVERERDIRPSLDAISTFDNEHQAAAVGRLAPTDYRISDKIGGIARIKGPIPVEALALMIQHQRMIQPSMASIARFSNEHQLNALRTLLSGPITYQISDKAEALLHFSHPLQAASLAALVQRALPVGWLLAALQKADSPERFKMIGDIAGHITRPVERLGRTRRIIGWVSALALMAFAAAGHWAIGLAIFGAAFAGLGILRLIARRAMRSTREANRRWLDDHPEIEEAFGALDDPELLDKRRLALHDYAAQAIKDESRQ